MPTILILIALLLTPAGAICGEETSAKKPAPPLLPDTSKSLMDEAFVVETTDEDATDSLNRIAGNIDNGFADEDSIYRSSNHGRSGPFARSEEAYDVSSR